MLRTAFRSAWTSVREHWTRSLLSALGILVGTTAVMLLISIANGVRRDVSGQIQGLGTNLVIVLPGRVDTSDPLSGSGVIGLSPFTRRDEEAVARVPGVRSTAKMTFVAGTALVGDRSAVGFILGCDPTWFRIRPHKFVEGGAFTDPLGRSAVIGSGPKEELFGDGPAVGKTLQVHGVEYEVVGVTHDEASGGLMGGGFFNAVIYLPFDTVAEAAGQTLIHRIIAQTDPSVEPAAVVSGVREAVKAIQGGQENFTVLTQEDMLEVAFTVMNLLTYLVVGISAIALFVGGVGVMTVMLMNVSERTREIGIRKTVGARKRDLFLQFLVEAVMLTTGGGLFGLAATWLGILLLEALTPIRAELTFGVVGLGLGLSVVVGTVSGLLPAMRAASKDPVVAMREE